MYIIYIYQNDMDNLVAIELDPTSLSLSFSLCDSFADKVHRRKMNAQQS